MSSKNVNKNEEFRFFLKLVNRSKVQENGKTYIEGIASSTNIDWHRTIFSEECQRGWLEDIESGLPTYIEVNHDGLMDFTKRIGRVENAWITQSPDDDNVSLFHIRAEINMDSPDAQNVMRIMESPKVEFGEPESLGLSIKGYVTEMHEEIINGEPIEVYDRMRLMFVGIVEEPSNPDSVNVAIARSINKNQGDKMSKEKDESIEVTNVDVEVQPVDTSVESGVVAERSLEDMMGEISGAFGDMMDALDGMASSGLKEQDMADAMKMFVDKYTWVMQDSAWEYKWESRDKKVSEFFERFKNSKTISDENLINGDEGEMSDVENKEVAREAEAAQVDAKEVQRAQETAEAQAKEVAEVQPEAVEATVERTAEAGALDEIKEMFKEVKRSNEDLSSKLDAVTAENGELKARLKELESKPATTPGAQISKEVERAAEEGNELKASDVAYLLERGQLDAETTANIRKIMIQNLVG